MSFDSLPLIFTNISRSTDNTMKKSSIEVVEEKLPPGFRFYPRDEELICDYLINKVVLTNSYSTCATVATCSAPLAVPQLIEVDLNKSEPWDIPETACVGGKEWYFYSRRDRKYATGLRTNRATATGYWKATGKDRAVYHSSRGTRPSLVGMRKTLVFYRGRAPRGAKSDWVMHEFRLEGSPVQSLKFSSSTKEDWVLCRVFHKEKDDASSEDKVSGSNGWDGEHDHVRLHRSQLLKPSTSSTSLMDDPYISFTQTQTSSNAMMNQTHHHNNTANPTTSSLPVPCFSILSHNQTTSYYYPAMVASSLNMVPDAPRNSTREEYEGQGSSTVIKPDQRDQQNHHPLFDTNSNANLKVVFDQLTTTTADPDDVPPSGKLKSKISSADDFGEEGNQCSDRNDTYISESIWRHRRY